MALILAGMEWSSDLVGLNIIQAKYDCWEGVDDSDRLNDHVCNKNSNLVPCYDSDDEIPG